MNGPRADPDAPTGKPTAPQGANRSDRPPKPRFALAIGIVGHRLAHWDNGPKGTDGRPLQLKRLQKIASDVHVALETIKGAATQAYHDHKSLFDDSADAEQRAPELTLVSTLADGADTIAAKAALGLGYALDAPLPFARVEYENNFSSDAVDEHTPAPLQDFRALMGQARSVLQLPGRRSTARDTEEQGDLKDNRAYEAAGLTVLSQADILLAVWDGQLSRGRGGTAEMVAEAARAGIPIVLVDANGAKSVELRWRGLAPMPAPIVALDDLPSAKLDDGIYRVIDELVRPPGAPEQRLSLERWFQESSHRVNRRVAYPLLMATLLARCTERSDIYPKPPSELAREDFVNVATPPIADDRPEEIARLAGPYGWADAIAIYFAQCFRSAFVKNFLFAALAVTAAATGASAMMMDLDGWWQHAPAGVEILLIYFVVVNTVSGRRSHWHHRWLEAREVAERLRVALPLWTLGLRPASFPGEEPTWTGWYARALVRTQGMRAGDLSNGALADERAALLRLLAGQCDYNLANAGRMHWMERALAYAGIFLFVATLVAVLDHLLFNGLLVQFTLGRILPAPEATIWLSTALPALATASYGIRVIGDFDGIFQRAERTHRQLDQLIAAIMQDPPDFTLLRARARSAADAMLGDVASWRLSAESRGLAIPG
jgi:hypothetical protein